MFQQTSQYTAKMYTNSGYTIVITVVDLILTQMNDTHLGSAVKGTFVFPLAAFVAVTSCHWQYAMSHNWKLVTYKQNEAIATYKHRTHTPRGTSTGYSAATIDVTSLPMRIEQVLSPILCSYPKCGRDRLPYIQQGAYCAAEEVGPNVTNNRI